MLVYRNAHLAIKHLWARSKVADRQRFLLVDTDNDTHAYWIVPSKGLSDSGYIST